MHERCGTQVIRRPVRAFLLGLGVLAMTAGVAGATHSPGQGPPQDLAAGTGRFQLGSLEITIHFNATSGPAGEDPAGRFFFELEPFIGPVYGRVSCLVVEGPAATVGGFIEHSQDPQVSEGGWVIVSIVDTREPSQDQDLVNRIEVCTTAPCFDPPPEEPVACR